MIYKAQGKVEDLTPIESVDARSGAKYRKQYLVLDVEANNDRTEHLAIRSFGAAVDETEDLRPGEDVSVTFSINSREWNGRWYTDLELIHARRTAPVAPADVPDDDLPNF